MDEREFADGVFVRKDQVVAEIDRLKAENAKLKEAVKDASEMITKINQDRVAAKAARDAAVAVRVKPLVWAWDRTAFAASSAGVTYRVADIHGQWMWFEVSLSKSEEVFTKKGNARSKEDAKAKADKRNEARILAALHAPEAAAGGGDNLFIDSLTDDQRTIHDALCDSAWLAGVKAGWNAGMIKDDAEAQRAFDRLMQSRAGHLAGYAEAKKGLACFALPAPVGEPVAWGEADDTALYDLLYPFVGDDGMTRALRMELHNRYRFHSPNPASAPAGEPVAWGDVLAERRRQIAVEGWTPGHDDQHASGQMARAAVAYAMWATYPTGHSEALDWWPWDMKWWKPTDQRRDLVKAGALILAEIERLDRAALAQEPQ